MLDAMAVAEKAMAFPYVAILDVLIVYYLVYRIILWTSNTHAQNLIRGLLLVFFIYLASHIVHFETLKWLLGKFATIVLLLIIIIFQPELRRFLERFGAGDLFSPLMQSDPGEGAKIIKHLLNAVENLSKEKVGALIVIEVSSNISPYIASGVQINADVSSDLIASLFWPGSPTHDGAVIIRENKVMAAGCLLPLSESPVTDRRLGTRHRAAIGLSENTDALTIVVSEETGVISLAENGNFTRYLNKEALETRLFNLYKEGTGQREGKWMQWLRFGKQKSEANNG